jgi:hypothetical protein
MYVYTYVYIYIYIYIYICKCIFIYIWRIVRFRSLVRFKTIRIYNDNHHHDHDNYCYYEVGEEFKTRFSNDFVSLRFTKTYFIFTFLNWKVKPQNSNRNLSVSLSTQITYVLVNRSDETKKWWLFPTPFLVNVIIKMIRIIDLITISVMKNINLKQYTRMNQSIHILHIN